MDYKEFKEQFVEAVKDKLEEMDLGDAKVDLQTVNKPNESYEAMTVTPAGGNVGVNMNVNRFYDAVEDGMPFEEAVNRASEMVDNGIAQMPEVDIASLKDYEQMKDKLAMEVVSSEANAELLSTVPHQNMEDMAVVYRFVLGKDDNGMASVVVTNSMLESYGVTPEQLHMDALKNAPAIKPVVIQGMTELMTEMMGDDFAALGLAMDPADEKMFVATVPDKVQGASVIAYQDFMDQADERLGGDFYILPSSIHEILLVKDDGEANAHDLRNMVMEVNETQVSPEEKLTDSVYHYDSKDHVFELGEAFEARQRDKKASLDEQSEEKGSVLKDLKDKKKEVATATPAKDAVEKATKSKGGEAL